MSFTSIKTNIFLFLGATVVVVVAAATATATLDDAATTCTGAASGVVASLYTNTATATAT